MLKLFAVLSAIWIGEFCFCAGSLNLNDESALSCDCGHRNLGGLNLVTRIVGGWRSEEHEIPWRVPILIIAGDGRAELCGGTIISQHWILSAAHCIVHPNDTLIVFNKPVLKNPMKFFYSSDYYFVAQVFYNHPGFNMSTFENDIRLIWSEKLISFSEKVSPVCLPWALSNWSFDNVSVLASGWGTTKPVSVDGNNEHDSSNQLLAVNLTVLSSQKCHSILQHVNDNMICTLNPGYDTCQGDSGGSIDFEYKGHYYAIGVISNGFGCAQPGVPGVYSKVTEYLDWIDFVTQGAICKTATK